MQITQEQLQQIILPDIVLTSRQNQIWTESGVDSLKDCYDKKHFKSYPYTVEYRYNSRGFRDTEWPDTLKELKDAIWCVGDSFTVGLGSPVEHTWVYQVNQQLDKRTINVSMDGASNQWIARKTLDIIKHIAPNTIIIQWSYIHRYEINDPTLSDEERRRKVDLDNFYDYKKLRSTFANLIKQIELVKQKTKVIHSFIPKFDCDFNPKFDWDRVCDVSWPPCPVNLAEFNALDSNIVNELVNNFKLYDIFKSHYDYIDQLYGNTDYISEIQRLDYARDGHHYDLLTAKTFAIDVRKLLLNRGG
jgi:hypothetical protein